MKFYALYVCILVSIYGCAPAEVREAVLTDGMKICAVTEIDGQVCIESVGPIHRKITWGSASKTIQMIPREERWGGMLGLYDPGTEDWGNYEGISRGIVLEGLVHVASENEVINRIVKSNNKNGTYAYSDDGLFIYFKKTYPPGFTNDGVIHLTIIQYMINGKKPKLLHSNTNNNITVYR